MSGQGSEFSVHVLDSMKKQAEILSRYAAHLEQLPLSSRKNDTIYRANLAYDMASIYSSAAELEQKS
jgi:hypothetical protein